MESFFIGKGVFEESLDYTDFLDAPHENSSFNNIEDVKLMHLRSLKSYIIEKLLFVETFSTNYKEPIMSDLSRVFHWVKKICIETENRSIIEEKYRSSTEENILDKLKKLEVNGFQKQEPYTDSLEYRKNDYLQNTEALLDFSSKDMKKQIEQEIRCIESSLPLQLSNSYNDPLYQRFFPKKANKFFDK